MMHDLKPYPAYKDSGVPWLDQVPEHWDTCSLGSLTSPVSERNRPDLPLLSVVREKGVIPRSTMSDDENHNYIPEDLSNYKVVRKGNLVINKMKAWQGSLGIAPMDGIVSPAYFVFDLRIGDPRFGQALLRSKTYVAFFAQASEGVRIGQWDLSIHGMKRIPVVVPPLDEQVVIVRFLDYVDRRIRRYIRAKQKLIKLLEEQKQAIIHRAVTRGLDPNVRLKPSGVEWLGDVPEHWEVRRFKTLLLRIDQGVSPQAENRLTEEGEWGVLKAGCVNGGVFREEEHKRLPDGFAFDPSLAVKVGDVLISRASGSPHLVGSVGRVRSLNYSLILSDKTFRPVFNKEVDPDFMCLAMNSRYYRQQVEQAISGAEGLANNLPLSSLRCFLFAIPPLSDQRSIVDYVLRTTSDLTTTIERAEREISLLREYRTRLIVDVVTGKLDVREVAARLPQEAEEPEPMDEVEVLGEEGEAEEGTDLSLDAEEVEA